METKEDRDGVTGDRLREVMIRDRSEMRDELKGTVYERDREVAEAARRASGGELDRGEQAARTAEEVFVDRAQIAAVDNALENQIVVEQEEAQERQK